ncbi:unnamed protein product [Pylaiella littoralis]
MLLAKADSASPTRVGTADPCSREKISRMYRRRKEFVKLVSAEGAEFWVDRKCAMVSGTIKAMLSGGFGEAASGQVHFAEISTPILEKVIQFVYYKVRYTNSATRIPEFRIEPELALELLMAANFLDC